MRNGKSGRHADITEAASAQRMSLAPAVKVSSINQPQFDKLSCSSWKAKSTHPLPHVDCSTMNGTPSHQALSSLPQSELRLKTNPALQSSPQDCFNSSFSFIQQSLNSSQRTDTTTATAAQGPEPHTQSSKTPSSPQTKPANVPTDFSKHLALTQSLPSSSQSEKEELSLGGKFWRECLCSGSEVTSDLPDYDSRSLDIEITSSLSLDSDTASASSVTSGYESATPASEQGWDNLVKKYEVVLQDCLQNNRTHTKVGLLLM